MDDSNIFNQMRRVRRQKEARHDEQQRIENRRCAEEQQRGEDRRRAEEHKRRESHRRAEEQQRADKRQRDEEHHRRDRNQRARSVRSANTNLDQVAHTSSNVPPFSRWTTFLQAWNLMLLTGAFFVFVVILAAIFTGFSYVSYSLQLAKQGGIDFTHVMLSDCASMNIMVVSHTCDRIRSVLPLPVEPEAQQSAEWWDSPPKLGIKVSVLIEIALSIQQDASSDLSSSLSTTSGSVGFLDGALEQVTRSVFRAVQDVSLSRKKAQRRPAESLGYWKSMLSVVRAVDTPAMLIADRAGILCQSFDQILKARIDELRHLGIDALENFSKTMCSWKDQLVSAEKAHITRKLELGRRQTQWSVRGLLRRHKTDTIDEEEEMRQIDAAIDTLEDAGKRGSLSCQAGKLTVQELQRILGAMEEETKWLTRSRKDLTNIRKRVRAGEEWETEGEELDRIMRDYLDRMKDWYRF